MIEKCILRCQRVQSRNRKTTSAGGDMAKKLLSMLVASLGMKMKGAEMT
jgi:hypothetical protein